MIRIGEPLGAAPEVGKRDDATSERRRDARVDRRTEHHGAGRVDRTQAGGDFRRRTGTGCGQRRDGGRRRRTRIGPTRHHDRLRRHRARRVRRRSGRARGGISRPDRDIATADDGRGRVGASFRRVASRAVRGASSASRRDCADDDSGDQCTHESDSLIRTHHHPSRDAGTPHAAHPIATTTIEENANLSAVCHGRYANEVSAPPDRPRARPRERHRPGDPDQPPTRVEGPGRKEKGTGRSATWTPPGTGPRKNLDLALAAAGRLRAGRRARRCARLRTGITGRLRALRLAGIVATRRASSERETDDRDGNERKKTTHSGTSWLLTHTERSGLVVQPSHARQHTESGVRAHVLTGRPEFPRFDANKNLRRMEAGRRRSPTATHPSRAGSGPYTRGP